MRRAAVVAFRTARLVPSKPLTFYARNAVRYSEHVLGIRQTSSRSAAPRPMHIRRFSAAVLSGLVGYGAWYTYKGQANIPGSVAPLSTYGPSPISETERKAVVVAADSLYTATIQGNVPISKDTDDVGRKLLEMLTPDQATHKLRRNEESYLVGRGKGVVRYDVVQIPSNDPIEDDHSEKIIELPTSREDNSDWMFWGVFDGHAGWTTSAKLRQVLISYVARELNTTYKSSSPAPPNPEAIDKAIKTGFTRLDNEIVHESVEKVMKANSKLVAAELLAPALSGSCALLSFYDTSTSLLRVACTGDSRAVLGRRSESGKWVATPLSVDQTGGNPDEEARLRKLHPGEENVVRNGRILGGLEPSRAFGDASYKWTREVSERLKASFFGRTPSNLLRTPPYVTAEPVVTTTKIQPEKGDFLVMATDGLWEMLTNEEVIGLVGQWIEKQEPSSVSTGANSWTKMFGSKQKSLPVENPETPSSRSKDGQKTPIRQRQWGVTGGENERFVVEDINVATHLVRNALGGKDTEMVCALLTLPAPYSRRYRDDLTVNVIFFGDGKGDGEVRKNKAASSGAEFKAKL